MKEEIVKKGKFDPKFFLSNCLNTRVEGNLFNFERKLWKFPSVADVTRENFYQFAAEIERISPTNWDFVLCKPVRIETVANAPLLFMKQTLSKKTRAMARMLGL